MIGKTIQQYQVVKKLGNGAMGSVYLATDTMLDRSVALKFILSDFNDHPDIARRFLEEARVLASLNCPNIPILYGYFIWEGKGVMAMEYVSGETLEEKVLQRGPIPAEICVPWVRQALRGLAAAHRVGVVHRDLKPSNLMLNQEDTVKVVDFGIAKKIEVEAGLTATNTTVGTPWYMAPEQILGKPVTPRTDVYSMGVVLYQLLAGQVPFNATSIFEIHTHHLQTIPEPPTIHYPHIAPEVVKAVLTALEKDPDRRFKTAEEFLRVLPDYHSIAETHPDVVKPKRTPSGPLRPVLLPQALPGPPRAQAEIDQAGAPIADHSDDLPPPPSPVRPSQQPGQRNWPLIGGLAAALVLVVGGASWFLSHSGFTHPGPAAVVGHSTPPTNTGGSFVPGPTGDPSTGGGSTTPRPESPYPSNNSRHDPGPKSLPRNNEPPRPSPKENPASDKSHNSPSPPGQELSGIWRGVYTDSHFPQQQTRVKIQIQELNGSTVSGTLSFTKADESTGTCNLASSAYNPNTGLLQLLPHCPDLTVAPGYLNTPTTLKVADPASHALTGHILGYPTVKVDISR